jgi:putative transposase
VEGVLVIMSNSYYMGRDVTSQLPQRQNLRLRTHDYSSPGYYFVTICTKYHTHWLGDITNGEMCLNTTGEIVQAEWNRLPTLFPGLKLDQFIIMPNHVHGILVLTEQLRYNKPAKKPRPTLSHIIDIYKGRMTNRIRYTDGIGDFAWQKSFYDEIIRDASMLHDVRRYIATNPQHWLSDNLYIKK